MKYLGFCITALMFCSASLALADTPQVCGQYTSVKSVVIGPKPVGPKDATISTPLDGDLQRRLQNIVDHFPEDQRECSGLKNQTKKAQDRLAKDYSDANIRRFDDALKEYNECVDKLLRTKGIFKALCDQAKSDAAASADARKEFACQSALGSETSYKDRLVSNIEEANGKAGDGFKCQPRGGDISNVEAKLGGASGSTSIGTCEIPTQFKVTCSGEWHGNYYCTKKDLSWCRDEVDLNLDDPSDRGPDANGGPTTGLGGPGAGGPGGGGSQCHANQPTCKNDGQCTVTGGSSTGFCNIQPGQTTGCCDIRVRTEDDFVDDLLGG